MNFTRFTAVSSFALLGFTNIFAQQDQTQEIEVTGTASANVTWDSVNGRSYFLQYSTDLVNWNYFPLIEYGDGTPQFSYGFEANGSKVFSRLHYIDAPFTGNVEDADFDKDGISNWNEIKAGGSNTKPFEYSSAGDGLSDYQRDRNGNNLPDGWELEQGPNLGALDPNADDDDDDDDGLSNFEESLLRTKADNPDTDGDDLLDGEDAVPTDGEIDWKRTPEYSYAWLPIEGATDKGDPIAVNKHGQVLFENGLWYAGSWLGLPKSGSLPMTVERNDVSHSATMTDSVLKYTGLNDSGVVVGLSDGTSTVNNIQIAYSSGMYWKPSASDLSKYEKADYFLQTKENKRPEDGVIRVGGIGHDGSVLGFGVLESLGDPNSSALLTYDTTTDSNTTSVVHTEDFWPTPGACLDANRSLFIKSSFNLSTGGESKTLSLYDSGTVSPLGEHAYIGSCGLAFTPTDKDDNEPRLWIVEGAQASVPGKVYLEKKATPEEAQDRWHHPVSMSEGATRVNETGEAITGNKVWRNGKYHSLADFIKVSADTSAIEYAYTHDLASNGIILASAVVDGVNQVGILLPVEIKVYRPEVLKGAVSWTLNRDEKVIPQEEIDEKGVGIRVNQDDDNGNSIGDSAEIGAVNGENDLIEIEFKKPQLLEGFDLVIKKSPALKVWGNKDKSNLVAGAGNEAVVPEGLKPPRSYWVESIVDLEDGELEFLLRPKNGGEDVSLYKIPFYTYKTFLVGLSGEISIVAPDPLDNGIYDVSERLYLCGYNVSYYDEDVVGNEGEGQAFEEVRQQVKTCFVGELGVFGHSHGGGSTYNLTKLLDQKRNEIGAFTIPYTGYVDAIKENSANAEDRFPPSAAHLLNYYQRDGFIDGFSVSGADNHNVTPWGLGHGGIDNDPRVIKAITDTAKAKINP